MGKQIVFDQDAREKIKKGVDQLANAVKATLGPRGRNAIISRPLNSTPLITKDGVSVAREINFRDPWMDMGAQVVKQVANKTNSMAGDGTTTATVLAQAILAEGMKTVAAGGNPISIKNGIEFAVSSCVKKLEEMAIPVEDEEQIVQVGTIAANSDRRVGEILAEAIDRVGKDGVITVEENVTSEMDVEWVEGMQYNKGYLSPIFITDTEEKKATLKDVYILLTTKKLTIKEATPLLEKVHKKRVPLLIIMDEFHGEFLSMLMINKHNNTISVAATQAPGFGDRRLSMMEDIAIMTGTQVIRGEIGGSVEDLELDSLGRADKVVIEEDKTTIFGGLGKPSDIDDRVKQLGREIESSHSEFEKEKLQERVSKLSGGVARIKVGAATELEMKEKKDRVEDALNATRAAVDAGILPGGGCALLRMQGHLEEEIKSSKGSSDFNRGIDIVKRALSAPIEQIAENAGINGNVVAMKVLENPDFEFGYNADTEKYCNLVEGGVIDPLKVVRAALQNASSIAVLLLSTNVAISSEGDVNEFDA